MAAFNYNASNMSEVFQMLESNNVDIVNEIKQLIYEQYEEGKARFVYCHIRAHLNLSGTQFFLAKFREVLKKIIGSSF